MSVSQDSPTSWTDLTSVDSESGALLDSLHEVITAVPHLQGFPAPPAVATPPSPSKPGGSLTPARRQARIRPVDRPLPSVFQQHLAAGRAVVEPQGNLSRNYLRAKRAIDIVGTLLLLAAISPILITVYLILLVTTRGQPIYRQVRLGYRGRPFTMYKFRTMRLDADQRLREVQNEKDGPIFKNRRDPRVTRLGRLLRMTSLDETPQLFNVLSGAMTLVGPRPPLAMEVAQYQPWQRRRLSVMPGLTCLWQVSGRSEIGFQDWVRMDLWYVRNQSIWTDLWLLVKTPWGVLTGRGAY